MKPDKPVVSIPAKDDEKPEPFFLSPLYFKHPADQLFEMKSRIRTRLKALDFKYPSSPISKTAKAPDSRDRNIFISTAKKKQLKLPDGKLNLPISQLYGACTVKNISSK